MNTFITDLLKILNPENFPIFIAIFLLVKMTGSLDRLSKAVESNCSDIKSVFTKLDDILVYLEYGIVRDGLFNRAKKSRFSISCDVKTEKSEEIKTNKPEEVKDDKNNA